jgi:protein-disulfide isomerase
MARLAAVALIALFSLSGPQSPQDEVAALRKEIEALKAQQASMQRDLTAIKSFLQALAQAQAPAPATTALLNKTVQVDGVPTKGAAAARVMMVEVSDYHCPFCRRFRQQTQPQIDAQYIQTGKIRYAFIDYPIAQLHPDAFRAHEAANCAAEQGKYWEVSAQLFEAPARDVATLVSQAAKAGVNTTQFKSCLDAGKYAASVRDSISRMQALGVDSTPMFLIGLTPPPGQPMKVLKVVQGAQPLEEFTAALDSVLKP